MQTNKVRAPAWAVAVVLLLISHVSPAKADTACQTTLTFGSGATTMNICISQHGNLVMFESPAGKEHIRVGTIGEGYEMCDTTHSKNYFDAGFSESGFGPATINQPGGPNTLPLTITRDTTDGNLRLKQTFARDAAEKDVTITMTLTNNSTVAVQVFLDRFFDGDIDGSTQNRYARTINSTWGWNDTSGDGLSLTALTFAIAPRAFVSTFLDWESGLSICDVKTPPTPTAVGDFVGGVIYDFIGTNRINPGVSKTVKVVYRRF